MTRSTLILFLTITLGLLSVPTQAQNNTPNIPYIYYYSPQASAFIIEKADGTDHRILTNYTLPKSDDPRVSSWIVGPGWSPSGEWFAWTTLFTRNGIPNTVPSVSTEAFLVSRDGATTISLNNNRLNGITEVSMEWSPQGDLLLVDESFFPSPDSTGSSEYYRPKTYVLDPETQEVVVEIALFAFSMQWSSDGRFIFVDGYNSETRSDELISVSLDGTVIHYQPHSSSYCWRDAINWSENGKIFYKSAENTLVLTDTISGESHEFEALIDGSIIYTDWSPDTKHALVYIVSECTSDAPASLWLVSTQNHEIDLIDNNVRFQRQYDPTRVGLQNLASAWSPNGEFALVVSTDNRLNVLDTSTLTLTDITSNPIRNIYLLAWTAPTELTYAAELELDVENRIFINSYSLTTNETTTVALPTGNYLEDYFFSYSNDHRYIAYTEYGAEGNLTIIDTQLETRILLPFLQNAFQTSNDFSVAKFAWHPDQNWLLIEGDLFNYLTTHINVANADGTIHRELVTCLHSHSCFGWLPSPPN